jgi:methylmalonyl-CoA epimerase
VRVCFLPTGEPPAPRLELIEPIDVDSGVARFLASRGEGLHHVCLASDAIRDDLAHLAELGAELIDAEPRIGAEGTLVAFVHPRTLNGVLWELRPDWMRMVATNGHRLAKMELPISSAGAPEKSDLIVPPKALEQIRRLFPEDEELEIARGDNHLGFRSPITAVYTRLIEGPYPNYEQVIPKDNDRTAVVERAALLQSLRRMAVVASEQTHRVRLVFIGVVLRFSVQTPDLGEATDEIEVEYQGEPLEIGFNAMYLLEMLKHMRPSRCEDAR